MLRLILFSVAIGVVLACAGQPAYEPWTPRGLSSSSDAGSAAPAPAEVDDGSRPMAVPASDDALLSIVGQSSPAAPSRGAGRAGRARRPPVKVASTPKLASTGVTPSEGGATPPAAPSEPMRAEARAFFGGRCQPCHGEHGRGDGPTGKALTPTPRNFTDRAWQASVTDAHIEKVILNGGPSVGKSPLMPPHADLADNPELLHAMRRLIRELGRS